MDNLKRVLAVLFAVILFGAGVAEILHVQSIPPTAHAAAPVPASKAAMTSADPSAEAVMKKLDAAFPGAPGADPTGVVVYGLSGARYILSPDAVVDFLGRDAAAPPNASSRRYTVHMAGNTVTVDENTPGAATTVVLTLPPPGAAPGTAPPLTVTTKDVSGTTSILTVPVAEYAKNSRIVKVAADGSATFVLPDFSISIKQGHLYNSAVSKGGSITVEGGGVSFSGNSAGN